VSERALRIAALAAIPRPGASLPRPAQSDARTRVEASARVADVYMYGVVGWDILAEELVPELAALDVDELIVHVNSPGGDCFDGIALANTLAAHQATVTVHVEGMAASAASIIAIAGDEVVVHPGARVMVHDALCLAIGNAADHRAAAELLDAVSQDIAGIYAARAGGTPDEWRTRMLAETWLGADESVALGLADRVAGREQPGQGEGPALAPAAHGWTDIVAQWRADTPDAARPAAPLAATCCGGSCSPPPPEAAPETSAPEAEAPPATELPTAVVNLSELICSAVREGVTL
jgi:ATP-dependent protease ClpP protease subunit